MKPQSDVALRIMQFVLAVLAAIVSLVLVTDAQIAGVLGLGTTDLGDAPVLLGRLRLVFRLALLFFLILVFLGVFSLIRRSLFPDVFVRGGGTGNAIKIVATDSGINAAIEAISAIRKPQTLRLWGYSLGWAARLSQHLEGNPNSQLAIQVFVPDES